MTSPLRTPCILAAVLFLSSLAAEPAPGQIPAGQMSTANGYAKDFAIVKRAGVFHVFHIDTNPEVGDFNYLGHQTSRDLYHWTVEPNVLIAGRSDWNPDFVWAPSIIERDGTYWMFYTGVRRRSSEACPGDLIQQIGVATSTDLMEWTLLPESWLDSSEVPWSLQPEDSCTYERFGNFRDPHVVWDAATNQWLMFYVTIPRPDSTSANVPQPGVYDPDRHVVGMARAPSAFAADSDWVNLKALWITHGAYPNGTGMTLWESPHAFSRTWQGQTLWFLFASAGTTLSNEGAFFLTTPSLTLDKFAKKGRTGWTWRGSIWNLHIHDHYGRSNLPSGWFATEYFRDPETGLEYFANVSIPHLEFRRLTWRAADYGFDLEQPFAVEALLPQPTSAYAGQPLSMTVRSVNGQDGGPNVARFEILNVGLEGESLGVAPPSSIGLPDSVVITNDETLMSWVAAPVPQGEYVRRFRIRLLAPWTNIQSPMVTIWSNGPRIIERPPDPHETAVKPQPVAPAEFSLGVRQSPAARPVFAFHLPERSAIRLDLYDLRGRRVRGLVDRDLPRGSYDVAWDAQDEAGSPLPSGIYFARLEAARGHRVARVVLLSR